ncbi:MAG: CPBP family intramembrane metalloprotease [Oscillospiraceae bacterium]|nr:CPBP family intramembrane metalloprotease [Oscillospiraceae bacterium]
MEKCIDSAVPVLKACRRAVGRIGLAMTIGLAVSQGACLALVLWLDSFAPASLDNPWVSITVSTLPIYLLCIPIVYLMVRRLPAAYPLEIKRIGIGATAAFALATYALFYISQIVTMGGIEMLSFLTERDYNNALEQVLDTNSAATFLVVGLLGPIMEELLFRGLILRRLLPYGRTFAVVGSAVMFGLFHANLFQIGYAFATGLALAYITVRTGSILHAAVMHVFFNTYSNLIVFMLERNETIANVCSVLIMLAAAAGVVVLVRKRKTIAYHLRPAPVEPGHTLLAGLKTPGFWLFVLACLGLAVYFMITL